MIFRLEQNLDKLPRGQYRAIAKDTLTILNRGFYKMYYEEGDDLLQIRKKNEKSRYREGNQRRYYYRRNQRRDEHKTDRAKLIKKLTKKRRDRVGYDRDIDFKEDLLKSVKIGYKICDIDEMQNKAVNEAKLYHHNEEYEFTDFNADDYKGDIYKDIKIECYNETTLYAMREMVNDPDIKNPVALNFASPKNAGLFILYTKATFSLFYFKVFVCDYFETCQLFLHRLWIFEWIIGSGRDIM